MNKLMHELNIEIPPYTELDLTLPDWQEEFNTHWTFRTPNEGWFEDT